MSLAGTADDQLETGVRSLPLELRTKIYNLVFTAEPGMRDLGRVLVSSHDGERRYCRARAGRPFAGRDSRALLQVDRSSRARFAASYYGGPRSFFFAANRVAAGTWLQALPPAHRKLIARLVVVSPCGRVPYRESYGLSSPHVLRSGDEVSVRDAIAWAGYSPSPSDPVGPATRMRWQGGCVDMWYTASEVLESWSTFEW